MKAPSPTKVDVVIPTTCLAARESSLMRALDSIASQERVEAEISLVINGQNYSRPLFDRLQVMHGVAVHKLEAPNLPAAISYGRQICKNNFFCFLDDDDILLPNSLAIRLEAMDRTQADVIVTAGIGSNAKPTRLPSDSAGADPLSALLELQWLTSCGGLYRASSVPSGIFSNLFKYFEWTSVALQLIANKKNIIFLGDLTFQLFDSSNSASKELTIESLSSELALLRYALALTKTADQRRSVRSKMASAHHELSLYNLRQRRLSRAWYEHLRALMLGSRTIPYTRHILRASVLGPT